jgi:hypothetical protein
MRILLYLLAALLPCQVAAAQFDPNAQIGANDPHHNDGMVFELPKGKETLYLTIVTHDDVQPATRDAQVLAWFDSDPRLNKLKKQCHFNHYWHSHPHYAEAQGKGGMGRCYGMGYPVLAVCKRDGQVLASAYYLNADGKRGMLPDRSSDLADLLWQRLDKELPSQQFVSHSSSPATSIGAGAIEQCRPDQPCIPNTPGPNVPALPEVVDPDFDVADLVKKVVPIAAVLLLCGGAFVLFLRDRQAKAQTVPNSGSSFFN